MYLYQGLAVEALLRVLVVFERKNPNCIIVAVEPKNVSALLGHRPGIHKIQGIGDGFIPPNYGYKHR